MLHPRAIAKHTAGVVRCAARSVVLLAVCLAAALPSAAAYRTRIEPGAVNNCYTETILPGGELRVAFEVTGGGMKDVDAELSVTFMETTGAGLLSSDHRLVSRQLTAWSKTTSGDYGYRAPAAGAVAPSSSSSKEHLSTVVFPHKVHLCISNAGSRWTPKWVNFAFAKQERHLEDGVAAKATVEHEMEVALHEDGQNLFRIQSQMVKVKAMEERHRDMIEVTNTWIMVGALINGGLLLGMSVFQFWYLTRFLSVRHTGMRV